MEIWTNPTNPDLESRLIGGIYVSVCQSVHECDFMLDAFCDTRNVWIGEIAYEFSGKTYIESTERIPANWQLI